MWKALRKPRRVFALAGLLLANSRFLCHAQTENEIGDFGSCLSITQGDGSAITSAEFTDKDINSVYRAASSAD